MMNNGLSPGSAKIYQFPVGGRAALGGRRYGEANVSAAAGTIWKRSRKPSRNGIADAQGGSQGGSQDGPHGGLRAFTSDELAGGALKRVETLSFRPFFMRIDDALNSRAQISSQAVTGRFRCLTVVPLLPIFNVTPSPE